MKILNVLLTVKPEFLQDFEYLLPDLEKQSHDESGYRHYQFYKQLSAENEYLLVEHWDDQSDFDAHYNSVHLQHFLKITKIMMVKEPYIYEFTQN